MTNYFFLFHPNRRHHTGYSEEVDGVAGGASGMDVDRIGQVGDRANERQAAGVYGTGFTVGSLAKRGARNGMWGLGVGQKSI